MSELKDTFQKLLGLSGDEAADFKRLTGCRPETESEMKEAMYKHLSLGNREETNKLYEFIEGIIEMHFAMREE